MNDTELLEKLKLTEDELKHIKDELIVPRKSDKRPKACDSPLQPC